MQNIKINKLKIKFHKKGNIIKMMSSNNKNKFGELYISIIKKNKIKGWKFHKKMHMNLFVIKGKVKFIFYDEKNKKFKKVINSELSKKRIFVPPKVWFAFQNISNSESKILNFSDIKHNAKESLNMDINCLPFKW